MTIEKVVRISEAIKSIADNDKLDFQISYRLGRIQDKCESIVKNFQKQELKLREKYANELKQAATDGNEQKQADINQEFNQKMIEILEFDEVVEIPTFELKDFENKGVPVKFFSALADYIKE